MGVIFTLFGLWRRDNGRFKNRLLRKKIAMKLDNPKGLSIQILI